MYLLPEEEKILHFERSPQRTYILTFCLTCILAIQRACVQTIYATIFLIFNLAYILTFYLAFSLKYFPFFFGILSGFLWHSVRARRGVKSLRACHSVQVLRGPESWGPRARVAVQRLAMTLARARRLGKEKEERRGRRTSLHEKTKDPHPACEKYFKKIHKI